MKKKHKLSPEEYSKSLSRKIVGTSAIFLDKAKRVLAVKPWYRDYWTTPGGVADLGESPLDACRREVKEEIGLVDVEYKLLCVDHITKYKIVQGDGLQFVFLGVLKNVDDVLKACSASDEIEGVAFVNISELGKYFSKKKSMKFRHYIEAIKSGIVVYLEDGERVS